HGSYLVQEFTDGRSAESVTNTLLDGVLPAVEVQAQLRPTCQRDRSALVRSVLFDAERDWLKRIEEATSLGKQFADEISGLVAPCRDLQLRADDLVHGDLDIDNVFVDDLGRFVAFIDSQDVGKGTRVYDLARLLNGAYLWAGDQDAKDRLFDYAAGVD